MRVFLLASLLIVSVSELGADRVIRHDDAVYDSDEYRRDNVQQQTSKGNVTAATTYEAPEPYEYLHDHCEHCNPPVEESPDPLVSMTWSSDTATKNASSHPLQIYRVNRPVKYWVSPADALVEFVMTDDTSTSTSTNDAAPSFAILVYQNCTITLDWGVERAAWFELISRDDLSARSNEDYQVQASISEYNEPYPGKTGSLIKYGTSTYRLETNPDLYEGVRFSFLHFEFFEPTTSPRLPIEILGVSLVAKIKPMNYTGAFASSDTELARAWYTGAYGVRLNMDENDFNSVLIERGDRVAIQGDGHPTIDAALVAFSSSYDLVRNVLLQTDSSHKNVVDDYIMAYPLYWCLSVMDYFMESGDYTTFEALMPNIMILLDRRIQDFLDPYLDITWFGWDDRVGNGWCFHSKKDQCTREGLLAFAGLVVRVCQDFVRALRLADMPWAAQKYTKAYSLMKEGLRGVPEWPSGFGVHAAANAINAGVATLSEIDQWMNLTLNDPINICSFSQFNQYWILQAFGNADRMEHALGSIKLCWGPMMKLGKGCFWEMSSPEWLSFMEEGGQAPHLPSYCHPWASGVTPWLSHIHAGLEPTKPGYKEFVAAPYVSLNYPSVSATLATPHGTIAVNATLQQNNSSMSQGDGGSFSYSARIQCPVSSSSSGLFGLRFHISNVGGDQAGGILMDLFVDGAPALNDVLFHNDVAERLGGGSSSRRWQAHRFVRICETNGTTTQQHTIHATYAPPSSVAIRKRQSTDGNNGKKKEDHEEPIRERMRPFPEPQYPATLSPVDRTSQGDGLYTYGRGGYLLVGCDDEIGTDIEHLPSYVSNVTIRRHGFPGWVIPEREYIGSSDTNPVYLPVLQNSSGSTQQKQQKRALGMVGIEDAGGGDINCIFVDIFINEEQPPDLISISVYFVAKTDMNQHAIRVMDGTSLNVIAPTSLITDFQGGVWWTLQYNGSVRLRLMDVKGVHLSAIAFTKTTTAAASTTTSAATTLVATT